MRKERNEILLERDRALIEEALKRYLKSESGPQVLLKAIVHAVFSGGKRLRPILALESARAAGGGIKKALPFACAVELVHNFSLVHDDLPAMDNDDFRRGKPACHKKFGEGIAILAGCELLNLAFRIIVSNTKNIGLEAAAVLSKAIGAEGMLGGQALDLTSVPPSAGSRRISSGETSYGKKHREKIDGMKTGSLMAASCEIGAISCGAEKNIRTRLHEFGRNFGLAFQILDDIKDSGCGKQGLGKRIEKAKIFISKTKKSIAPLGARAKVLTYIADKLLE